MATTMAKTACILCARNCGLNVDIEDSHLVRIRGDEDHPISRGYLCQKAARLDHYQNHEDRLRHPLRRKPDGSFEQISWDVALDEIAQRLLAIRARHGGDAFALVGGGGQGNHLGGAYGKQMLNAMGSRYAYNALAQEKTGDFWINGRLFGRQNCHITEDVEHADFVMFIGTNPYQSHGIPNARDVLRAIKADPARTMVVIDPRRTETAKQADIHLQLKPGTDAFLMSALLALIVREQAHDSEFLARHCTGFEAIEQHLASIPIEAYVQHVDVRLADVERVAREFARANSACVRVDLGIQHTLHSTLNSYLEKLLFLITGNFGKRGGNNLHTHFLPIIGHSDERLVIPGKPLKRTAVHGVFPIGGMYPPNILPDEIMHGGEQRLRAILVDSANPILNFADSQAYRQAFQELELLVVVDVSMTETARLAHYILPAASQFEKFEATGFTLEFPANGFHLRHPILPPLAESLPEPEIYTRLLMKMGVLPGEPAPTSEPTGSSPKAASPILGHPKNMELSITRSADKAFHAKPPADSATQQMRIKSTGLLAAVARWEPAATQHMAYLATLGLFLKRKKHLRPYAASILYRTLGKALPDGAAAAAPLLPLAVGYALEHGRAVQNAGHRGRKMRLGGALFRAILQQKSGVVLSRHEFDDTWSLLKHPDKKIHLEIPELLAEWRALAAGEEPDAAWPFILQAGERRAYNANQIYRDPSWRKTDKDGALRLHPDDAAELGVADGGQLLCRSERDCIQVTVKFDDSMRRGAVSLPHGYGNCYQSSAPQGPEINRLTSGSRCDPIARTPWHKYVPVRLEAVAT